MSQNMIQSLGKMPDQSAANLVAANMGQNPQLHAQNVGQNHPANMSARPFPAGQATTNAYLLQQKNGQGTVPTMGSYGHRDLQSMGAAYGRQGSVPGVTGAGVVPVPVNLPASRLIKEKVKFAPGFTASSVDRMPLKSVAPSEWSTKLKNAGEDVPLDVKVYEDIVQRDLEYLRQSAIQGQKYQAMVEKMALDIKTYNLIKQQRMNAISAAAKNQYNNSIWGDGYQGYGNGSSNTATQVILPAQAKRYTKVPDLDMTEREIRRKVADSKPRQLVPIRLDFDQERDRFKLRDTFLWNMADETYPLDKFVRTLIEDYKFILEQNLHTVLASVAEQIKDFRKIPDKVVGEIRVPIKIDLVINNTQFVDQFEWDILNAGDSDPEDFANVLCDEMCLPGEFATAVAFSIREQTQLYHKALFLVGYNFDGSPIREDEIRSHILPVLRVLNPDAGDGAVEDFVSTLRNPAIVADYSPSLNKLTQLEVEKIDKEMERESRRRRRHFNTESNFSYNENGNGQFTAPSRGTASRRNALHAGRGVKTTLPDLSEIPKTFRTPMPSSVLPGGIDLGVPDIFGYNELIVNRTQIKNPDYKQPAPPGLVTSYRDSTGSFYVKILLPRRR